MNISKFLLPNSHTSPRITELRNLQTRRLTRHARVESAPGQRQSGGIIDEAGGPRVSLLGRISAPTACTPAGDCVSRARRIDQVVLKFNASRGAARAAIARYLTRSAPTRVHACAAPIISRPIHAQVQNVRAHARTLRVPACFRNTRKRGWKERREKMEHEEKCYAKSSFEISILLTFCTRLSLLRGHRKSIQIYPKISTP